MVTSLLACRLGQDLVDVDGCLLRRRLEPALDPGLHGGQQGLVAELLPALLRVVHGHDRPTTGGGAGGVKYLTLRQLVLAGMDRGDRCLVLLLGPTREVVDDSVGHDSLVSTREPRQPLARRQTTLVVPGRGACRAQLGAVAIRFGR